MTTAPTCARRSPEGGPSVAWPDAAGEGPGACAACGRDLDPGEALRVIPSDGRRPFAVCRAAVSAYCLRVAGIASRTTIALYDERTARQYDHEHAGPDPLARAERDALRIHARRAGGA